VSSLISVLLLAVHFVAVDLTMAGPLVCVWLAWREARRDDPLAGRLNRELAWASLWGLVVGIGVGCLELVRLWLTADHDFWRAVAAVPAGRLWFSLAELVFFAVCMAAYVWLGRRPKRRPRLAATLAILAALDLMAHFPPLFTMLNLLADRPGLAGVRLESPLYRSLLVDPEVAAMTLHVYLAAVAVTATLVMSRATRLVGQAAADAQPAGLPAVVVGSARAALAATLLQIPLGIAVLLSVPSQLRDAILGEDLWAAVPFGGGILATLALLHTLAAVALGDRDRRQVHRAVILMLATVFLMTAALSRIRQLGRPAGVMERVAAAVPVAAPPLTPNARS